MNNVQQKFFDYFMEQHNLITLESDFDEVQSIMRPLIEQAFIAGRSKTSWEQFQKDNDMPLTPERN
jgi:hypothetical protein